MYTNIYLCYVRVGTYIYECEREMNDQQVVLETAAYGSEAGD